MRLLIVTDPVITAIVESRAGKAPSLPEPEGPTSSEEQETFFPAALAREYARIEVD